MTKAHLSPDGLMVLDTPGDYHFEEALVYLNRSESECLHQVEGRTVYKALHTSGGPVLMAIGLDTEEARGAVSIRFRNGVPEPGPREEAARYVREWLDLDTDIGEFLALCASDPILAPIADRNRGLRLIGVPSLLEALCWTVAGQQINLAFAYTLKKRLVETYGTRLEAEGREWRLFPGAQTLAALEPSDLQALQFTRSKSETLLRVARLIAGGELSKEALLLEGMSRAEPALTSIKGIGPWTANYVMMRCLRHPDAFPLTDVGVHHAIRRRLGRTEKPSLQEVEELSAAWSPWRAYATFYLWASLAQDV
ncbi:DNA-3-methyladenine glycosylase family protein [Gorillibacterium sp. sgz5001074]|uniref:DNA-3-methyladenine glycosylase family protein n=1 Tax=Gorillibacterium sp. sgz5001074 TaxID=3446695 RepID=UPI003F6713D3